MSYASFRTSQLSSSAVNPQVSNTKYYAPPTTLLDSPSATYPSKQLQTTKSGNTSGALTSSPISTASPAAFRLEDHQEMSNISTGNGQEVQVELNRQGSVREMMRKDLAPVTVNISNIEKFLKNQLDNKIQDIRKFRQQKSKLEDTVRQLQRQLKTQQKTVKNQIQSQTTILAAKEQQFNNQNKMLKYQVEILITQKNQLIAKLSKVLKDTAEQVSKPQSVSQPHNQLENAINQLTQSKRALERELDDCRRQVVLLRVKLDQSTELGQVGFYQTPSYGGKYGDEEGEIVCLQKENIQLKQQLINSKRTGFDDQLRNHMEEANRYKDNLADRNEEIRRLQSIVRQQKSRLDIYVSQLDVEKLKAYAQRKSLITEFENERQLLINMVETLKKQHIAVGSRLQLFVDENRRKDEFIKQYVMGKVHTPNQQLNVEEFFRQYEVAVPCGNLAAGIKLQSNRIEHLQNMIEEMHRSVLEREGQYQMSN